MMRLLLLGVLWLGCGDDNLAGVGEPCNSSGDCAIGLLCDFGKTPHACEPAGEVRMPDLSVPRDLSGADLSVAAHD
jgi:hypothetical protein